LKVEKAIEDNVRGSATDTLCEREGREKEEKNNACVFWNRKKKRSYQRTKIIESVVQAVTDD